MGKTGELNKMCEQCYERREEKWQKENEQRRKKFPAPKRIPILSAEIEPHVSIKLKRR